MQTKRLKLRQWQPKDRAPFAKLNGDAHALRFFERPQTEEESNAIADRIEQLIADKGWGFWALERLDTGDFIGFAGLHLCDQPGIPQTPMVEVGWRLLPEHWGQGFAPEAAALALDYAFETLKEPVVYAFTALPNAPSRRVMEKLGMHNSEQDFDHPKVADGHPNQRHCLYQIDKDTWFSQRQQLHYKTELK